MSIVKTATIDGKQIEVHDDGFSRRRYWVKVDGRGLFQRGRMRVRAFTTVDAAYEAALEEALGECRRDDAQKDEAS